MISIARCVLITAFTAVACMSFAHAAHAQVEICSDKEWNPNPGSTDPFKAKCEKPNADGDGTSMVAQVIATSDGTNTLVVASVPDPYDYTVCPDGLTQISCSFSNGLVFDDTLDTHPFTTNASFFYSYVIPLLRVSCDCS
jgi:hypothetical protein